VKAGLFVNYRLIFRVREKHAHLFSKYLVIQEGRYTGPSSAFGYPLAMHRSLGTYESVPSVTKKQKRDVLKAGQEPPRSI
jgi:hypothetical protein